MSAVSGGPGGRWCRRCSSERGAAGEIETGTCLARTRGGLVLRVHTRGGLGPADDRARPLFCCYRRQRQRRGGGGRGGEGGGKREQSCAVAGGIHRVEDDLRRESAAPCLLSFFFFVSHARACVRAYLCGCVLCFAGVK